MGQVSKTEHIKNILVERFRLLYNIELFLIMSEKLEQFVGEHKIAIMQEKERNAFLEVENDLEHQIKVNLVELQNYVSEIKNNSELKKEIQLIWKDIISKAKEDANFMDNFSL